MKQRYTELQINKLKEQCLKRALERLSKLARSFCNYDKHVAEEVVSMTLVKIINCFTDHLLPLEPNPDLPENAADRYKSQDMYINEMFKNTLIDFWRKNKRYRNIITIPDENYWSKLENIVGDLRIDSIKDIDNKELLKLCDLRAEKLSSEMLKVYKLMKQDLSSSDIAAKTGVSENTCNKRKERIREYLIELNPNKKKKV